MLGFTRRPWSECSSFGALSRRVARSFRFLALTFSSFFLVSLPRILAFEDTVKA